MSIEIAGSPVEADTHTHTVASTHAFSTVYEMSLFAAQAGLKAIVITDHGPLLPDGAHEWHFGSLRNLPPVMNGVRVLHGCETNIMDFEGTVDLKPRLLKELDWIVASFHEPACAPGTPEDHTRAYLKLAENPYVDVIGHSGNPHYVYDYEKVLPVFQKNGKLIEINSHSFHARRGSPENCLKIALLCKELRLPVVVNSDAHSCYSVGDVFDAMQMLEKIDFPKELIVNLTFERLAQWIGQKRGRRIES